MRKFECVPFIFHKPKYCNPQRVLIFPGTPNACVPFTGPLVGLWGRYLDEVSVSELCQAYVIRTELDEHLSGRRGLGIQDNMI